MARAFFGNFDFESQLSGRQHHQVHPLIQRRNRELAWSWTLVADRADQILGIPSPDTELLDGLAPLGLGQCSWHSEPDSMDRQLEPIVWGESRLVRERFADWNWTSSPMASGTVERVNSRQFSAALERIWKCGLPGSTIVKSEADLNLAIRAASEFTGAWMLKSEFSMAGRGQMRGRGKQLPAMVANWVRRRLRNGEAVVAEPIVNCVAEWSFHFQLGPEQEDPHWVGATKLETDRHGGHRGNWSVAFDEQTGNEQLEKARSIAEEAAGLIFHEGYRGPLGIDAMLYEDSSGQRQLRPLQDINARMTMGRLLIDFCHGTSEAQAVFWLHERWARRTDPRKWWTDFKRGLSEKVTAIRCSPFEMDQQPVELGMVLLMAENSPAIRDSLNELAGAGLLSAGRELS